MFVTGVQTQPLLAEQDSRPPRRNQLITPHRRTSGFVQPRLHKGEENNRVPELLFSPHKTHTSITTMSKRTASDNTRGSKRRKPKPVTVLELRGLLSPYNDDDSADVIFQDQKNHTTLERLYASLRRFTNVRQREKARVKSITTKADVDVPSSISCKFPSWLEDPHKFWWPTSSHSAAPETPLITETYRRLFVQGALQQYSQLQSGRILARFTSIVLYLSFLRMFPQGEAYQRTKSIRNYLQFMGCDNAQNCVTSYRSILTAGRRRLMFCDALAKLDHKNSQSGQSHNSNAAG